MKKTFIFLVFLLVVSLGFSQRPDMVFIEGGSFYMGNDYSKNALDEKPEHEITLDDFYISKHEVTYEMYEKFCLKQGVDLPNDGGYGGGNNPVINVSWVNAIKFCNWMSTTYGYEKVYDLVIDSAGTKINSVNWEADGFRLPTEAEWEYVAKSGSKSTGQIYAGSNDPKEVAWFSQNSDNKPHAVGQLKANELGVYDIMGNAWEWCWDFYAENYYSHSPETNPRGPETGDKRVYRGGNFESNIQFVRITRRFALSQNQQSGLIGIRVVQNSNSEQP